MKEELEDHELHRPAQTSFYYCIRKEDRYSTYIYRLGSRLRRKKHARKSVRWHLRKLKNAERERKG